MVLRWTWHWSDLEADGTLAQRGKNWMQWRVTVACLLIIAWLPTTIWLGLFSVPPPSVEHRLAKSNDYSFKIDPQCKDAAVQQNILSLCATTEFNLGCSNGHGTEIIILSSFLGGLMTVFGLIGLCAMVPERVPIPAAEVARRIELHFISRWFLFLVLLVLVSGTKYTAQLEPHNCFPRVINETAGELVLQRHPNCIITLRTTDQLRQAVSWTRQCALAELSRDGVFVRIASVPSDALVQQVARHNAWVQRVCAVLVTLACGVLLMGRLPLTIEWGARSNGLHPSHSTPASRVTNLDRVPRCCVANALLEEMPNSFSMPIVRLIANYTDAPACCKIPTPADLSSRLLGEHPFKGGSVVVKKGRYGPYVSHDGINAALPRDQTPENVTLADAVLLIDARAAKLHGRGHASLVNSY